MGWATSSPARAGLVVLLFTVVLRLPYLLDDRQVIDESCYSVIGIEMLNGGEPYVATVDRKPPLLFYTYAAIFSVVGPYNFIGLHFMTLLWALATMLALYWVARRLFDWRVGVVAASFYGLFQVGGDYRNQALNGEMMMNLPIVLSIGIVFARTRGSLRPELIAAGALLALAFLFKQPAAVAAVPLGLYLLLPSYRASRGLGPFQSMGHAALLTLGYFGTLALFAWWLHEKGVLQSAIHWTGQTDFVHGPADWVFWERFFSRGAAYFFLPMAPLVACAFAAMGARAREELWRDRPAELVALVLLLPFSGLGCAISGRFFVHHYLQLLPPLCLLGAPVLVAIFDGRLAYRFGLLRRGGLVWTLGFLFVGFTIAQTVTFQVRFHGGEAPEYVRGITAPDERIFVWGPSADFYADAHRAPASRYVVTFPLTGFIFGSPLAWDESYDPSPRIHPGSWERLARDLDEHEPRVLVDEFSLRGGGKYSLSRYPYLRELVETEYELAREFPEARVYVRRDSSRAAMSSSRHGQVVKEL